MDRKQPKSHDRFSRLEYSTKYSLYDMKHVCTARHHPKDAKYDFSSSDRRSFVLHLVPVALSCLKCSLTQFFTRVEDLEMAEMQGNGRAGANGVELEGVALLLASWSLAMVGGCGWLAS